jgi:uncharacterized protein
LSNHIAISKSQARRLLLVHQGLGAFQFTGKEGVLGYIKRVGSIQFDILNIVGRNPELVLQARIADFQPYMLDELLYKERRLVDGVDKEMSIYSIDDWPYFRRHREAALTRFGNDKRGAVPFLNMVRTEIEKRGPLSSSDLSFNDKVEWPWGPTRVSRAALESMYLWGELIIHHKEKGRKVYDMASRHLAAELQTTSEPNATKEEYHDWYTLRRIGAVGLLWGRSGDAWRNIPGLDARGRQGCLTRLLEKRRVIEFHVQGIRYSFYMRSEDERHMEMALSERNDESRAAIIAPLDNMLWDRELVGELFNFDYRWEVYKPVNERQYGYYVLPVLYGDRFIARFEPGRDRKTGALIIKRWWWEPGTRQTKEMKHSLSECFGRFMAYLGTNDICIDSDVVITEGLDWVANIRVSQSRSFHY